MAAVPTRPAPAVPWTLRAAATVTVVKVVVEAVAVAGRTNLTAGLRGTLIVGLVGLTWLLTWRALRLSAGAALGLLLLEGTTVVAAFGAVATSLPGRLALGGAALLVIVLILASLHAFPSPTVPTP